MRLPTPNQRPVTNPIESMISSCRTTARNVKPYRDGEMALR
jgi:hypothetical protein